MLELLQWKDVYQLWEQGRLYLPNSLSGRVDAERAFVEYHREGMYIYGFDWLDNEEARSRKQTIEKNPTQFLLFTEPSNKGTIRTAQLLTEAVDEEERAAIWIAATAFELAEHNIGDIWRFSRQLYDTACTFLQERFYLWHHAMRKLVPEIMIPHNVLMDIQCSGVETVMGLIQINTLLLKSNYSVLCYISDRDEDWIKEKRAEHSLRR